MTNNGDEQISALVDGELSAGESRQLLDRMRHDGELKDRWTRYHLISDAFRNNLPTPSAPDLHDRIRLALEAEPVVFAPPMRSRHLPPFMRQVAGFAVAASVTAVAILGFQYMNSDERVIADAQIREQQTQLGMVSQNLGIPESSPELDPYLVNHNEYSSGMHGVFPYVRIVSHGTSE